MDATNDNNAVHAHGDAVPPIMHGALPSGGGPDLDPEFYATAVGDDQDMDDIISRMMDANIARGGGGAAPASAAAIAKLRKKNVDESMLDANGKADCIVCSDDAEAGETVTELPCKHWFHEACVNHWLSSHGTCPNCREKIAPDDEPSPELDSKAAGGPKYGGGSQPEASRAPHSHDPFDGYRDELLARSIQMAQRPSLHDDEAFARSLQEEHNSEVHDDEALARRLYEESQPSAYDDEALARRLYEESRPSAEEDAEMARRMHEESEALARRLQEENEAAVQEDEAMARRLQEEADREHRGNNYGPSPGSYRSASGNYGAPPGNYGASPSGYGSSAGGGGSSLPDGDAEPDSPPGSPSSIDRFGGYGRPSGGY